MPELSEKDIEARDESRTMLKKIYTGMFGDEQLDYPGMVKDITDIKSKQEADYTLLLPNRMLFFICKKPVYLILALTIISATAYGMSYPEALKLGLRILGVF